MPKKLCKVNELHLFESHLLRLDGESRYTRFQGIVCDDTIRQYVQRISQAEDQIVLGKFCNDDIHVIGGAHVAIYNNLAELAFSVELPYRGNGYGKLLFERSLEIARDHNCNQIHTDCFTHNRSMMALAKKFGLKIDRDGPEASASMPL